MCRGEPMLSQETLERYRRMTNADRMKLTMQMIEENTPNLLAGAPDVVERRFELLRRQNDERTRRIVEGMAHLRKAP
jgi:hypothetical protein